MSSHKSKNKKSTERKESTLYRRLLAHKCRQNKRTVKLF